jgi:hypothetical protein
MPRGRADEPLHAFGDVFPQAAANGQLDGAPSGSHVAPSSRSPQPSVDRPQTGHLGRCTRTVMTAGKSDLS